MKHASLFSGIGGFDLAAEWMGWENVFHCEINEFGQKILKYYWPKAISYGDITKTDFTIHRGAIDVLTGGFPCQPYSLAGERKGKEDTRHLWPEMLRAIREIKPQWIVGENVPGIINWSRGLVFEEVQANLETEGYKVQPILLPACAIGADHRRDRVWFIAYSPSYRRWENSREYKNKISNKINEKWFTDAPYLPISESWLDITTIYNDVRMDDGLPFGMDRLKALGNAIVPQVALQIFKVIQKMDSTSF